MRKARKIGDGLPNPRPDTKIRYLAGSYGNSYRGREFYVAEHPADPKRGIVISGSQGSYHGHYCTEWEELGVIDLLSDEDKQELSNDAWKAAKSQGYCKETKDVLNALGLPQPVENETKRLEVQVPKNALLEVTVNGQRVNYRDVSGRDVSVSDEDW